MNPGFTLDGHLDEAARTQRGRAMPPPRTATAMGDHTAPGATPTRDALPHARSIFVRPATTDPNDSANQQRHLRMATEASADHPDWWTEPDPDQEDEGATTAQPAAASAPVRVPGPEVKYLDANQAAAYLGVGPRLIRRLAEERRVTVRKVGKYRRFTREDLDAAVEIQAPIDASTAGRIASKANQDDPVAMVVKRSLSNMANSRPLGIVKEGS